MEIRIGVQNAPREIVLDSDESPEAISKTVSDALAGKELLQLKDGKGRLVIVPTPTLAYVEVLAEEPRRVGFAG